MPIFPRLGLPAPSLKTSFASLLPRGSCARRLRALLLAVLGLGAAGAHATTFTVINANDSGAGSLRQAILDADSDGATNVGGNDTIDFSGVTGTITLASPLPAIYTELASLTITGPGASLLTVSGANAYTVFTIHSGIEVNISGLTIADGNAGSGNGGGIGSSGTLNVSNCAFIGNKGVYGGAIVELNERSPATVIDSTFSGNSASGQGGAIYTSGVQTTITGSTFSGNSGSNGGGAIGSPGGQTTITNSTFPAIPPPSAPVAPSGATAR